MKSNRLKTCLRLFLSFMMIGAFTFGGGYAMIPMIQKEAVEKRKWVSDDDILEIIAIAESTPGPIAINAATFIGYRVGGFFGALCATFGVVLPSFAIILAIAGVLREFAHIKPVKYAFMGIRAGVLALIIKALITMYKKCPRNVVSYIVIGASFILAAFVKAELLTVIIGCALFGLVSYLIRERRNRA